MATNVSVSTQLLLTVCFLLALWLFAQRRKQNIFDTLSAHVWHAYDFLLPKVLSLLVLVTCFVRTCQRRQADWKAAVAAEPDHKSLGDYVESNVDTALVWDDEGREPDEATLLRRRTVQLLYEMSRLLLYDDGQWRMVPLPVRALGWMPLKRYQQTTVDASE